MQRNGRELHLISGLGFSTRKGRLDTACQFQPSFFFAYNHFLCGLMNDRFEQVAHILGLYK